MKCPTPKYWRLSITEVHNDWAVVVHQWDYPTYEALRVDALKCCLTHELLIRPVYDDILVPKLTAEQAERFFE